MLLKAKVLSLYAINCKHFYRKMWPGENVNSRRIEYAVMDCPQWFILCLIDNASAEFVEFLMSEYPQIFQTFAWFSYIVLIYFRRNRIINYFKFNVNHQHLQQQYSTQKDLDELALSI